MQYLLMSAGAWEIVSCIQVEPAAGNNNARYREDLRDFRRPSQLALSLIFSSIPPALHAYIHSKTSPSDMWDEKSQQDLAVTDVVFVANKEKEKCGGFGYR